MEFQRVQMKAAARQAMKLQRPHPMLITLLFTIIVNIGSQLVSRILGAASGLNALTTTYAQAFWQHQDPERAIQYALLSFGPQRLIVALLVGGVIAGIITTLWSGIMRVGYTTFCLGMVRGQQPQTGALFSAFPQWAGVLLTQFLVGLFRTLWASLFGVAAVILIGVLALLFSEVIGLFMILLLAVYIALLVGVVWVTLRYAMVDFLIADQGITGMDAIRESKRLMQGNIGRLFTLQLSFFGWYLLGYAILMVGFISGMIVFGSALAFNDSIEIVAGSLLGFFGIIIVAVIAISVLDLWLVPYITGTQALFYDWLRGAGTPAPGSWGGGQGGWGQPYPPRQDTGYTWTPTGGPNSGTGIGPGPQGGPTPPQQPPRPPRSPKDDPWE